MRRGEKGNGGSCREGRRERDIGKPSRKMGSGEEWIEGRRREGGGGSERREDHVTVFTSSQVVLHMGNFTPFLIAKR